MFSTFKNRKSWLWWFGSGLTLFGLVAFTENRLANLHCESIDVQISGASDQRFLTRKDVSGFLTNNGADPIVGKAYDQIDLGQLEGRLRQYSLIRQAHVSHDLAGNLLVHIEQPEPVARLVSLAENGIEAQRVGGQYISAEGRFFPLSMNYTARVPLISGAWFSRHRTLADKAGQPLLALLRYIRESELWRAQIAELTVSADGEVTMWLQVGTYQIEFGTPDDIETKFKKVKLFYTQIAPRQDWGRYKRVSVQYRNQLVCE
jgi:cell division protein FtsQ